MDRKIGRGALTPCFDGFDVVKDDERPRVAELKRLHASAA